MFNELKKDCLFELKEQLVALQEEKNKNVETIRLLSEKEIELVKAKSNIPHDEKYIQFENTYSKISKLFNKKKYNNEKQDLCAAIREEYDT